MNVAFLEVRNLCSAGNDTDPETIPQSMLYATSKSLYIGASVGIQDDLIHSGTLGGCIILTCGSEKYDLGVTNCHVVSLKKLEQGVCAVI